MSAGAAPRVGRVYTAARRHPWVLGKIADWRLPLGPYTPAQIAVATLGGFALVKTVSWWAWLGPIPVVAWAFAIWAVRRPQIAGRAPLPAMIGALMLALQPAGGRIGGRAVRERAARPMSGAFVIEDDAPADPTASVAEMRPTPRPSGRGRRLSARRLARRTRTARRSQRRAPRSVAPRPTGAPRSSVQLLLTQTQGDGRLS
ncbi:hypothetical protein [Streptomyces sp. NPDC020681]|uniref:hypothetical protein n=1 Tax=Streptomyces sp. NPDC020681 TaxID=3365083 RepID=UPI00379A6F62